MKTYLLVINTGKGIMLVNIFMEGFTLFHYTVDTSKGLNQAVEDLQKNLKEEKFGVLWDFNLKETLNNKGLEIDNTYRILEVCNPHEAQKVISKNPLVSYFLPCKIVVYEEKGQNKIGMPKPTSLIGHLDNDELKDIAKDIEDRLKAVIDQTK